MGFAEMFGESPRNRLLDFLGDHPSMDYPITELAEATGISRPTIYADLSELLAQGLVVETRVLGRSRLFKLNTDHAVVREVLVADIDRIRNPIPAGSGRSDRKGRR
ncbi:MAG: helix-turn-helix transcriptional regulator [Euryarchaeota archaeon]|nr:helix-turn-helix transcriptional regulator [Euryarchaeota archaeon]